MHIVEVKGSLSPYINEDSTELVVVEFYSFTFGLYSSFIHYRSDECKEIARPLNILSRKYTDVRFLRINVDTFPSEAQRYSVQILPTFLFFHLGKQIDFIETPYINVVETRIVETLSSIQRLGCSCR